MMLRPYDSRSRDNSLRFRVRPFAAVSCLAMLSLVASSGRLRAADPVMPANIDGILAKIAAGTSPASGGATALGAGTPLRAGLASRGQFDALGRVLVNIHLDGTAPLTTVKAQAAAAGAAVVGEMPTYNSGVFAAFVPLNQVATLARAAGVLSLHLSHRPVTHAGKTTSGGVAAMRADVLLNNGYSGAGITVGVLSDSFNVATLTLDGAPLTDHAADDVASDDLPGIGNPKGNTTPVNVIDEYLGTDGADEGRAMCQIVHDVAPKAALAFATAFNSEVEFAQNIIRLRTEANCDVIVDDVSYFDEPFFSDGMVSQAVDQVVNSTTLPGKKCSYFSSAGNAQGSGWADTFQPVSDVAARAGIPGQNLNLTAVDPALTSGGFHNFNDDSRPPDISQTYSAPAGTAANPSVTYVELQWNDPFNLPNGITTDYNFLIFDADGTYENSYSGIDNNVSTQQPIEFAIYLNYGPATTFQVAITRAGKAPFYPVASKLRTLTLLGGTRTEYIQYGIPTTYGHEIARGTIGTAAYIYDGDSQPGIPPLVPKIENFTSSGPAIIYFDAAGRRLPFPEIRQKPDIAAPDGVNTTFFGFNGDDIEGDGFPNFFGTSAAAPHAAAVAALLLQGAGGPQSLTEEQIRFALQASPVNKHDLNPFFSAGLVLSPLALTVVSANGDATNISASDPNFFTIHTATLPGQSLLQVTIDLTNSGLKFDSRTIAAGGFPFTLGKLVNIDPSKITTNVPPNDESFESLTLNFAPGAFTTFSSVSFGIDRDLLGAGGGNSADLLSGAVISARTTLGTGRGTINNIVGRGYSPLDGYGFIDALNAASRFSGGR